MRDLAVALFLVGCIWAAAYRAWWGVLALAVFAYLNPHTFAWGFARTLPAYQVLLIVVVAATLFTKDRQPLPKDWRIPVFYALWAWYAVTTIDALLPALAWPRLWWVSKVYIPLIFMLILINTREKLFWLLATIAFSVGVVAAKGGIFALMHGFQFRVWGPEGTMYGGNNEFAIMTLMAVPLLALVRRELAGTHGWQAWLGRLAALMIPLSIASAISSWSRGALVTLAVLTMVMWWHSRRKVLFACAMLAAASTAPAVLPEEWFERMHTIETYEEDASAMGRITAWRDGLAYVASHPITAGGFEGWRYITERDWHSAYVEILAEHGVPGAALWGALLFGTLLTLTRLARQGRKDARLRWLRNHAVMLRASLLAYMGGALTLGITYWDLMYQLVFCAALLRRFALQHQAARAAGPVTISAARAAGPVTISDATREPHSLAGRSALPRP